MLEDNSCFTNLFFTKVAEVDEKGITLQERLGSDEIEAKDDREEKEV